MRGINRPLMLAGFIGLALACQESDAPTTSTREARQGDDGKVTAADGSFPSPTSLPSQPGSPGNPPSGPSPNTPGSAPSPGNPPSNPSPANPPSFPSPTGGGGGGGTPTPTPTGGGGTPTPTPTPTGGGGVCPATDALTSTDIPFNVPADGTGPSISTSKYTDACRILGVRVAFRVSATNLQVSTFAGRTLIALNLDQAALPVVRNFHLVDLLRTTGDPLLGTQMGTTCPSNLRFVETFPPFSTAAPPYVGAFRPYGEIAVPGGSGNFNRFDNLNPNGFWRLAFSSLDGPVTVECLRIEFDLAGGGGGGGLLIGKE